MAIKNTQETVVDANGNSDIIYRQTTAANVLVHESSTENARAHLQYYAVCASPAADQGKAISVAGGTANVLASSVLFTIKFTNGNTDASMKINVNELGAKTVSGANLDKILAGQVVQFTYNGEEFILDDTIPVVTEAGSGTLYPVMTSGTGELVETSRDKNMSYTTNGGLVSNVTNSTTTVEDPTEEEIIKTPDKAKTAVASGKLGNVFKGIKKVFSGLGTAAFKESSEFATAEQGAKADKALTIDNLFDGVTQETAGVNALDAHAGLTLQNQIDEISSKISSFEEAKSNIVSSALGKQLGLTSDSTLEEVANTIVSVVDYSNTVQYATTDTSDQSKSCYQINGNYIDVVPARGLWDNWDWDASCIKVPFAQSNLINLTGMTVSVNFGADQNVNYYLECPTTATTCIALFSVYRNIIYNSNYEPIVTFRSEQYVKWFNNTKTQKYGYAILSPGGAINIFTGKNDSNIRLSANVTLIYQ